MGNRRPLALWLCILATGCMSMTRGRSQVIQVDSDPPGAAVSIRPLGGSVTTPGNVELLRKPETTVNVQDGGGKPVAYAVTVSRAGYKDAVVPIHRRASGKTFAYNWVWIHPVFWGIGLWVDFGTGAGYELVPSTIFVKLEPATNVATDTGVRP